MGSSIAVGRFAPSITGLAHPGTLLSALLVWLDIRSVGGRVCLRLEDLDRTRLRPGYVDAMLEALEWLGLDWDELSVQSELAAQHEGALDELAAKGLLYPCSCSRSRVKKLGRRAPDGGFAYDNHCRERVLVGDWRQCVEPLRLRLSDVEVALVDEGGTDLSQRPSMDMGDPVVRRRDGAMAYHLAVVVDDAAIGVNRVVRGRDLAASTATQLLIHDALELPHPVYRHHLLLLEESGGKLAKMHGSIGYDQLSERSTSAELCGQLAHDAGLIEEPRPCTPSELATSFDWRRVGSEDRLFELRANDES